MTIGFVSQAEGQKVNSQKAKKITLRSGAHLLTCKVAVMRKVVVNLLVSITDLCGCYPGYIMSLLMTMKISR